MTVKWFRAPLVTYLVFPYLASLRNHLQPSSENIFLNFAIGTLSKTTLAAVRRQRAILFHRNTGCPGKPTVVTSKGLLSKSNEQYIKKRDRQLPNSEATIYSALGLPCIDRL